MNIAINEPIDLYTETERYYDSIAHRYDIIFSYYPKSYNEYLCYSLNRIFKQHGIRKILDCGCGTGNPIIGLAKLGYDVVGIDLSASMLSKAKEKCRDNTFRIDLIKVDWRAEIFPEESFDCVMCRGNSIFHLYPQDVTISLKNWYRMLKKGGICYVDSRKWDEILLNKPTYSHRTCKVFGRTEILVFDVYEYFDDYVIFNIHFVFRDKYSLEILKHEIYRIRCFYVFRNQLIKAFLGSGFTSVELIRGGEESDFDIYLGKKA